MTALSRNLADVQREQRLGHMINVIARRSYMTVSELSDELGMSLPTVRRDLAELERRELVSRSHGGVRPHVGFTGIPLVLKAKEAHAQKAAIAARAAGLIGSATVIGLSGGTTVAELSTLLSDRRGLSIVTNAITVAAELGQQPGLRVFCAGGEVRHPSLETWGPSSESFFVEYNIDIAFLGADGVDADAGCTNYDPTSGRVIAALVARSQKRVVLVDSSKIGRVAMTPLCPISAIDVLITDSQASQDQVQAFRDAGCEVILV